MVAHQFTHTDNVRLAPLFTSVLLSAVTLQASAGWIDMDTPLDKRTTTSFVDGTEYHLVMSDEFNVDNRTFKDGHDNMWTALDKSDDDASAAGGGSMQFYNSSNVYTENGYLKIATLLGKTEWNRYDHVDKTWKHEVTNFTSGMVQSWDKFCFTGGIIEVDVILPGDPYIGGLWPAVWMLGNLGRATYEASTNNIWPWSYNQCNRSLQQAQTISACNNQNHFGMKPHVGRGATEIDIVEVMTGYTDKPLISTNPPIWYPYADFTLQTAPGVPKNRPQSGRAPLKKNVISGNGHTQFVKDTWYEGLEMNGNTSINPFFYGTYMGETKPNEPVTRTKKQAFQADAVGAAHQLTPSHFEKPHTFRVEWQPGPGGRIDWFVKAPNGVDWVRAYTLKDESLRKLMGSQIPIEPTYIIFNTAVSSTWGFPYDTPDWCPKCYDCDDPKCACAFYPGFCQMLRSRRTAMYIDHIRIYQSKDPSAHVGANHTVGCDPPEYPTREWIRGHEYRYMRNPPFSYEDKHPLRQVHKGGGKCNSDVDCGGNVTNVNYTAIYEQQLAGQRRRLDDGGDGVTVKGRGKCVLEVNHGVFGKKTPGKVCKCNPGFTGPHCMSIDHIDDSPSAYKIAMNKSPFVRISHFRMPGFMVGVLVVMLVGVISMLLQSVRESKNFRYLSRKVLDQKIKQSNGPVPNKDKAVINENVSLITGTST